MAAWTIPLIGYGLSKLNQFMMPESRVGAVDPRQFKGDLLPDTDAIRSGALRNASMLTMPIRSDIKQYGAANRLPAGAVMSGLRGAAYQTAKAGSMTLNAIALQTPPHRQWARSWSLPSVGVLEC